MLTLITGRGKSGKTRLLLEAVKACYGVELTEKDVPKWQAALYWFRSS